jgi:hypothetical protein
VPLKKQPLTGYDAVVCLALAARLHRDPMEIKRVAGRLMKLMRRLDRGMLAPILATKDPHALIWQTLKELDDDQPPLPSLD